MRKHLRTLWTASAVVVPIASGIAWACAGHGLPACVGVVVGLVNAALLIRRRLPLRIPSFVPPERRPPVVIESLQFPCHPRDHAPRSR